MKKADNSSTYNVKPYRIDKQIVKEVFDTIDSSLRVTFIQVGNDILDDISELDKLNKGVADKLIIKADRNFDHTDVHNPYESTEEKTFELNNSKGKSYIFISDSDDNDLYAIADKVKEELSQYDFTPLPAKVLMIFMIVMILLFGYTSSVLKDSPDRWIAFIPIIVLFIVFFTLRKNINTSMTRFEILLQETLPQRKFSFKDKWGFILGFLFGILASVIANLLTK